MIRLAHMTDIHISSVLSTLVHMWTSKRLLGGMNMLLFRPHQIKNEYLPFFVEHMLEQSLDLVTITGDLTTTALKEEFSLARELLQPLIDRDKLVTIPGNHDVYTHGAVKEGRYEAFFGCCHGKSPVPPQNAQEASPMYPFVRSINDEAVVIGLNTCVPTGFFQAWGIVDDRQLEKLGALLDEHQDKVRVVLMHHFLQNHHGEAGKPSRWIRNLDDVLEVFAKHGAELILHGHKHDCYHYEVEGKNGSKIPVYNAGPATWHSEIPEERGGYQVYDIDRSGLQRVIRFRFNPDEKAFSEHILL